MNKIVSKEEFKKIIRPELKSDKNGHKIQKIALCHGVFDLVHPGHIIHLQQAKEMADVRVVSITSSKYVRKGPGRPYFNDEMRLKFLAALECVDYVLLSEGYTVDDIIEAVEPDFYVKGEEYANEDADVTGKIAEERELVERHGGHIAYTGGQTFSSTKLINTAMSGLSDEVLEYMTTLKKMYSMEDVVKYSDGAKNAKILVVGDVIIDKYSYCQVQGLMSKDMGYSAKIKYSEEYLGGSIAIARHLSGFSDRVKLLSMIGSEPSMYDDLHEKLDDQMELELVQSEIFPTIVKHRYLTRNAKRDEYKKVLAVNNIPEKTDYEPKIRKIFEQKLKEEVQNADIVFLCDFGHGLINKSTAKIILEGAKKLALNCQTNSSNHGLNVITKYSRSDAFALDQTELKLAYPELVNDEEKALKKLSKHLNSSGWLTRGSEGAYGISEDEIKNGPALTLSVKDTVGAGDAFFAIACLYTLLGAPNELGTLMPVREIGEICREHAVPFHVDAVQAFGKIPLFQVGIPAVFSIYFDVFSSLLQAFIFCMLTMMYIGSAAEE